MMTQCRFSILQKMIPAKIHTDDLKWFKEQMSKIPSTYRAKACKAYAEVWQAAHDAEPLLHCKENAGRFAANSRLRAYIKKVHAALAKQ